MKRLALLLIIIVPALCFAESDSTKWKLTFDEILHVPDSVHNHSSGSDMVTAWRKSPEAESYQLLRPKRLPLPYDIPKHHLPEPRWFSSRDFDGALKHQGWKFVEEELDSTVPEGNSRWNLMNDTDTVYTFIATPTRSLPLLPIRWGGFQGNGYKFVYNRCDVLGEINKWGNHKRIYSIHAVINGVDISRKGGYEKSLAPVMIENQLFYLFQKDGKWGYYFDGEEHPNRWDRVHYDITNQGWKPNFVGRPSFRLFSALRDGNWYHVVGKVEPVE